MNTEKHMPLPKLFYRPNSEFDDWGVIRNREGHQVLKLNVGLTEEEMQKHRVAKTDPCKGRQKEDALNESRELLKELDREKEFHKANSEALEESYYKKDRRITKLEAENAALKERIREEMPRAAWIREVLNRAAGIG